jgi:integrase
MSPPANPQQTPQVVPFPDGGSSPKLKLLDRVRRVIRARHYSRRTEHAYVHWIRRYIVFHRKTHPSEMGAAEISTFLTWLAVERHMSASTQNQALSALLFLYKDVLGIEVGRLDEVPRARLPIRVPVVLSRDEVSRVLKQLTGQIWIIVVILYGAGLRIQDCLGLRVKDIDFDRHPIVVRRGKGRRNSSIIERSCCWRQARAACAAGFVWATATAGKRLTSSASTYRFMRVSLCDRNQRDGQKRMARHRTA